MVPFLIGVSGGTGSGKTTLTESILANLQTLQVGIIQHDWYYHAHTDVSLEERAKMNYDHPDSLETSLMVQHLKELKAGQPIQPPRYNYVTHTRMEEPGETVCPTPVIVIEGILLFADRDLRDLFDLKIFVQTEADLRLIRRLKRDMVERGRSFESAVNQYLDTVRPMHETFVEPSKKYADIIVPASRSNKKAIAMISDMIHSRTDRQLRNENEL